MPAYSLDSTACKEQRLLLAGIQMVLEDLHYQDIQREEQQVMEVIHMALEAVTAERRQHGRRSLLLFNLRRDLQLPRKKMRLVLP
jgi:hypothetical protein